MLADHRSRHRRRSDHQAARRFRLLAAERLESRMLLAGAETDSPAARAAIEAFNLSSALFVENQGQWADESIRYLHQGNGANVAMTDAGPVFQVFREVELIGPLPLPDSLSPWERAGVRVSQQRETREFSVSFPNAQTTSPTGLDQSDTTFNYQIGDAANWRSAVPSYEAVAYDELYPGIDLHTWGQRSNLKYEFHVAPGAAWTPIQIAYDGIDGLSVADDGSLVVNLAAGWEALVDAAPYVYQEINGHRVEVASRYELVDAHTYTFALGQYDANFELVIDPELAWSTYLGGTGSDAGYGIAVDGSGNVLVTGSTASSGWMSGGYDTSYNGGTTGGSGDAYVVKLSAAGQHLWSTYLGGTANDNGYAIAVDGSDNVLVTGETRSSDWVSGGHDTSYNGGSSLAGDGFVVKLSPAGQHLWSTYLGGYDTEYGYGVAVDSSNNVLVTGGTQTPSWVSGGFDTTHNGNIDGFVVKLSADGQHIWSTYFGGMGTDSGTGIAVDGSDNVLVTGTTQSSGWVSGGHDTTFNGGIQDAFVVKLSAAGQHLWSTYLGGTSSDFGHGIAVDGLDNVLVAGERYNPYDTFVAKLSPAGQQLWITYLGGTGEEYGHGITVDSSDNVLVSGLTNSSGWVSGGHDTTFNGGNFDAFVVKLTAAGQHLWSTYLGGTGDDRGIGIAVDGSDNVLVIGPTYSAGWVSGGYDTTHNGGSDGFVAKILLVAIVVPLVAVDDAASTIQGIPVVVAVLDNDSAAGGGTLTVQSVSSPAHGSTVVNGNGTVTYTPVTNYVGQDTFTYTVTNGSGSATATVTITIVPSAATLVFQPGVAGYNGVTDTYIDENAPATSQADAATLIVDSEDRFAATFLRFENIFGNAPGLIPTNVAITSATLELNVTSAGDHIELYRLDGTWSESMTFGEFANNDLDWIDPVDSVSGGEGTFLPPGTASIDVLKSLRTWHANPAANFGWLLSPTGFDVRFDSSEGAVPPKLTVSYVVGNVPPTAQHDSYEVSRGLAATLPVLENDSDGNLGETIRVVAVSSPGNGTATIEPNGTAVTYVPNPSFLGDDSFTYTIDDGTGLFATATVNVTVLDVVSLFWQDGRNNYTGTIDTYVDEAAPTSSFATATTLPLVENATDYRAGLLRFDNLFGTGQGQIPLDATIVSAFVGLYSPAGGIGVEFHTIFGPWTDADTYNSLDRDDFLIAGDAVDGVVASDAGWSYIDVTASLDEWSIDPSANSGWMVFTDFGSGVTFDSSEGARPPVLFVDFIPPNEFGNHPPIHAGPDPLTTNEEVAISLTGDNALSVSDFDSGSLTTTLSLGAGEGTLTATAAGATVTGSGTSSLTISGSQTAISATLATLVYTPTQNYSGTATLTILTSDSALSDLDFLSIAVTPINDAPNFVIAADPPASQPNGLPQSVSNFATNISRGPADEAAQTVTFQTTVTGTTGNLAFTSPPAITSSGRLTYTPSPGTSGTATVSVILTDNGPGTPPHDNTSDPQTFTITVANPPATLRVASFTPTDTGFVAQFNRPLTTSDLNLYDQGGMFGPTDVTVVGSTVGNVRGSLVVNAAGDQVTFVRTNGVFANDTYTVTLRSATNAFRDAANLLDGNADGTTGDHYVATFTVNQPAAAIVASVPDFARGRGQVVNVWNSAAQTAFEGIPVLLSSGVGVGGIDFTVHYDPALLSIDAVKLGPSIDPGASLGFTIPTPGTIQISVNHPSGLTTTAGQIALVSLLRADPGNPGQFLSPLVPITAAYGAKHVLDIADLQVYDSTPLNNALPAIANDGVHLAVYPGDLNGSQTYNAPDTSFLQQLILNQATFGLAAYPLADPVLLADINGNGQVQANDTAQIQRLIVGFDVPFVPPRPVGLPTVVAGLDPKLFITTSVPSAAPGETFTMSLNMLVTEAGGITFGGVEAGITYDPALFTVTSVFAGDWTTGDGFSLQADFSTLGVITFAALTTADYLEKAYNSQGTILTATLLVNADAAAIPTSINLTDAVTGVPTALYDGTPLRSNLVINPAVTDGYDAGVDAAFAISPLTDSNGVLAGGTGQDILSGGAGTESSNDDCFSDAADEVYDSAADDIAIDNATALAALWATRSGVRLDEPRLGAVDEFAVDTVHGEADGDWYLTYQATGNRFTLSSERNLPNRIRDL